MQIWEEIKSVGTSASLGLLNSHSVNSQSCVLSTCNNTVTSNTQIYIYLIHQSAMRNKVNFELYHILHFWTLKRYEQNGKTKLYIHSSMFSLLNMDREIAWLKSVFWSIERNRQRAVRSNWSGGAPGDNSYLPFIRASFLMLMLMCQKNGISKYIQTIWRPYLLEKPLIWS